MIRRLPGVLAALTCSIGLTSCATFQRNDAAAVVNGSEISRDRLESLLGGVAEHAELFGVQYDQATGTMTGAPRGLLSVLVSERAAEQFLAEHGVEVTDADRVDATGSLSAQDPFYDLPTDLQALLVNQQALPIAVGRVEAPSAEERQRRYEEDPAGLGVMCVRHILTATEAEAADVLAALEDGADFAALAAERSIDPTAVDNGGALEDQTGSPCLPLSDAVQSLDRDFMAGALRAAPGSFEGPVETQFGWHVIEAIPYAEAEEALNAMFENNAGALQLFGYVFESDISVDPRYGTWDLVGQRVETLR